MLEIFTFSTPFIYKTDEQICLSFSTFLQLTFITCIESHWIFKDPALKIILQYTTIIVKLFLFSLFPYIFTPVQLSLLNHKNILFKK